MSDLERNRIPSASDRYAVHDREAMTRWWRAVLVTARATVTMKKGSRIYVTERIEDLAAIPREQKFVKLHIVSVATGSQYEWERFLNTPAVERLIPADDIAHIAPIVDAETGL